MVEPVDPFQGGEFHGLQASPRAAAVDHLGLVEADDRFCQSIVVAVPDAADRRFETSLGEAFGVFDRDVLDAAIAVVDQAAAANRAAFVERLLKGVEDEAGAGRGGNTPTDDAAGKGVDDESRIDEALPGRDVGEVGDPSSVSRRMSRLQSSARQQDARGHVRAWGLKLAVHAVHRARCRLVAERGLDRLAADGTLDAQRTHQPFDCTAGNLKAFPAELPPDLARSVDLEIRLKDPSDLDAQSGIASGSRRALLRVAALRHMRVVRRRGDLQQPAVRLDPERHAMRNSKPGAVGSSAKSTISSWTRPFRNTRQRQSSRT